LQETALPSAEYEVTILLFTPRKFPATPKDISWGIPCQSIWRSVMQCISKLCQYLLLQNQTSNCCSFFFWMLVLFREPSSSRDSSLGSVAHGIYAAFMCVFARQLMFRTCHVSWLEFSLNPSFFPWRSAMFIVSLVEQSERPCRNVAIEVHSFWACGE
jgi:hypothetical protein